VTESERSSEARELAETALAWLLTELEEPAGLEGYLLPKCVAARTRAADKDYYDLPYVLLHNRVGGPAQAATQLREGQLAEQLSGLRSTFVELRERYGRTSDRGPTSYAEQMRLVEPDADASLLRADAVAAVQEFLDELGFDH